MIKKRALIYDYMHACTYVHIYKFTHLHTYTRVRIYIHVCTSTHIHTSKSMHLDTVLLTYMHTYIQTNITNAHEYKHTHRYILTYVISPYQSKNMLYIHLPYAYYLGRNRLDTLLGLHIQNQQHTRTRTNTQTHKPTNTHTHTHVCTYAYAGGLFVIDIVAAPKTNILGPTFGLGGVESMPLDIYDAGNLPTIPSSIHLSLSRLSFFHRLSFSFSLSSPFPQPSSFNIYDAGKGWRRSEDP